jgi:DNA-binding protein H-NS
MSLTELSELRRTVDAALSKRINSEREVLRSKLAELDTLNGSGTSRTSPKQRRVKTTRGKRRAAHPLKGKKAPVKYRGPSGETWSGRGLAPRWLSELEAKGKKRESYLIKG